MVGRLLLALIPVILLFTQLVSERALARQDSFIVRPIGRVEKSDKQTRIVLEDRYTPGLLGLERYSEVLVIWWFHKNETPEKRSILQVHPRGDKTRPLRGVFATRAPVRPNLIGLSRCKVRSVRENVIVIDEIDAYAGTPVLDLKPAISPTIAPTTEEFQ